MGVNDADFKMNEVPQVRGRGGGGGGGARGPDSFVLLVGRGPREIDRQP